MNTPKKSSVVDFIKDSSGERAASSEYSESFERRKKAIQSSPEEKFNYVKGILIPVPQHFQAIEILQSLFDATGQISDPGGVRIMGESGTGKSVICEVFYKKHAVSGLANSHAKVPVLVLEMEQKVTAWSFLAGLLRKL